MAVETRCLVQRGRRFDAHSGGSHSVPVGGQVAHWLAGFDARPTTLSPGQAAQWVIVWRQEEAVGARSQLP